MAVYYFAYGINMDRDDVTRRCPGAVVISLAVLERHRFLINRKGWATVVPHAGSEVFGVLWRVGEECLERLDEFEGVAEGLYERSRERIRATIGETSAEIYLALDREPGVPEPDYLEGIIRAAERAGATAEYLRQLDEWKPER